MEEETPEPQITQKPVETAEVAAEIESVEEKPVKSWFKIVLFSILGIILAAGLVFAGYKLAQLKQVKPGPQPTPTPVVVATPTPDPTANWKTYTNTKYGYSIKYPPEMESKKLEPSAAFGPIGLTAHNFIVWGPTQKPETEFYDGLAVTLGMMTNPEELSLREFADQRSQPVEIGERESFEEIQVGNLKGFKAVGVGLGRFTHIFLPYKTADKVVQIIATWGGEKKKEYQDTFNLMLSTFKFLE